MNRKFFIASVASCLLALATAGSVLASGAKSPAAVLVDQGATSLTLHFTGAEMVALGEPGTLNITTRNGDIWHYRPKASQTVNGKFHTVVTGFHIVDQSRVELRFENADPSAPVVLAPLSSL